MTRSSTIEGMPLDPGLVREIGGRLARGDARFDDLAQGLALRRQQTGIEPGVELIDRQVQRMENEIGGFVERIAGAVAIDEAGRAEPAHGITQPVAYRDQLQFQLLRHGHS